MPLEPENGPATLLRQPETSPSPPADPPGEAALSPLEQRRARILAVLPSCAPGLTPVAVQTATGLTRSDVANDLRTLRARGDVVRVGETGQHVRTGPMPTAPQGKAEGARARRPAKRQAQP